MLMPTRGEGYGFGNVGLWEVTIACVVTDSFEHTTVVRQRLSVRLYPCINEYIMEVLGPVRCVGLGPWGPISSTPSCASVAPSTLDGSVSPVYAIRGVNFG